MATGIKSLNQQVSSVIGIQSSILAALHRAGSLPDEDYRRLVTTIAEHLANATQPFVDSITAATNPLSAQEARRFQQLVAKAQESEFFTHEEVEEYNRLLERVQRDRGDDPAIWPLVALGAFLLGLYLGGQRQE